MASTARSAAMALPVFPPLPLPTTLEVEGIQVVPLARPDGPSLPPSPVELDLRRLERNLADEEEALRAIRAALEQRERELTEREADAEDRASKLRRAYEGLVKVAGSISVRHERLKEAEARTLGQVGPSTPDTAPRSEDRGPSRPGDAPSRIPSPTTVPAAAAPPTAIALGPGLDPLLRQSLIRRDPRWRADSRSSGTPRLDDLLLGGFPPRSHVALVGDAFVGKEVALYSFLAEGLRNGERAVIVTASWGPREVERAMTAVMPDFPDFDRNGRVTWLDASGAAGTAGPNRLVVRDSDDRAGILAALGEIARSAEEAGANGTLRLGFVGLTSVLAHNTERENFTFLRSVARTLRPLNGLVLYALEAGSLSGAQVESFLARMDGALLFRQERDRTLVSVKGFADVATREWVSCRISDREIVLGSFALERVR